MENTRGESGIPSSVDGASEKMSTKVEPALGCKVLDEEEHGDLSWLNEIANQFPTKTSDKVFVNKIGGKYDNEIRKVYPDKFTFISSTIYDEDLLKFWINDCLRYNLTSMIVSENPEIILDVVKSMFKSDNILVCRSVEDVNAFDCHHTVLIWIDEPVIPDEIKENKSNEDAISEINTGILTKCKIDECTDGTAQNTEADDFSNLDCSEDDIGCFLQDFEVICDLMSDSCQILNIPKGLPRVLLSSNSFYVALEAWGRIKEIEKQKELGRNLTFEETKNIYKDMGPILLATREIRLGFGYNEADKKFFEKAFGETKPFHCSMVVYK